MHREFSITSQLATLPRRATLYPPDDTPDAQRGFLFCRLASARKYLYVLDETECLVGGKVTAYLIASKYGDATGFCRTCSGELLAPCPYPSHGLATPHIFAIPHNNLLSSSLGGLSLSLLHLRSSPASCTLHFHMYPVLSIYSSCRFFYRSTVSFVLSSSPLCTCAGASRAVRAHIVRSKDTRMCGHTLAVIIAGTAFLSHIYVTSANADIFCI